MEETLASPKMSEIDLLNNLEKISSSFKNRILIVEGDIHKDNQKEILEIIIFKGLRSSTTHPIEIDVEKQVLEFDYILKNFKLYRAPLTENKDNFIKESHNSVFFLNPKNWI
jgi:hypothetical protein